MKAGFVGAPRAPTTPQVTRPRHSQHSRAIAPPPKRSAKVLQQAVFDKFRERLRKYYTFAPSFLRGKSSQTETAQEFLSALTAAPSQPTYISPSEEYEGSIRVVPDPIFDDGPFQVWLRDHQNATREEVLTEIRRRNAEKIEHERLARLAVLRKWQSDLAELEKEEEFEKELRDSEPLSPMPGAAESQEEWFRPRPERDEAEYAAQESAWEVFIQSRRALPMPPPQRPSTIQATAELHEWVLRWRAHTHVHEAAAVKIQCAWRCCVAARRTAQMRSVRCRMLQATLECEEGASVAWEMAVSSGDRALQNRDAVDVAFKALSFFRQQMAASIRRRRKAMQRAREARAEVEDFAAAKIQALFQGIAARKRAKDLRHPQIAVRRRAIIESSAAIAIQRQFRGWSARRWIRLRRAKAVVIQRLVRGSQAVQRLTALRKVARRSEAARVAEFAARTIQRFMRGVLRRKYRALRVHLDKFAELQRVGRGYLHGRCVAYQARLQILSQFAVSIQTAWRRHQAEKAAKRMRAERDAAVQQQAEHQAALLINRASRRYLSAKHQTQFLQRWRSACIIQRVWRGHVGRSATRRAMAIREAYTENERRREAAVAIQAAYRGYCVRQAFAETSDAAVVIQRCVRQRILSTSPQEAAETGNRCQKEEAAVVIIQCCFRTFRARAVVAARRDARSNIFWQLQLNEAATVVQRFYRTVILSRIQRRRAHRDRSSV